MHLMCGQDCDGAATGSAIQSAAPPASSALLRVTLTIRPEQIWEQASQRILFMPQPGGRTLRIAVMPHMVLHQIPDRATEPLQCAGRLERLGERQEL